MQKKMNSIKIIKSSSYLPANEILNDYFNNKFSLDENWIYKRTGIKKRYFAKDESITDLAIEVAKDITKKIDFDIQEIGNIIVASTSTNKLMPGISFEVQKALKIEKCMCFDILSGCSGYINAFDLARKNILLGDTKYSLIIGVEKISNYLDFEDINTSILLGDGAGATIIGKSEEEKIFYSNIESIYENNEILQCHNNTKLKMDGKLIYKFAINKVTNNIKELLLKANISLEDIKYIIPHQSNLRILEAISQKLKIPKEKMYVNLQNIGNTFCASIPIALAEINSKGLLNSGDKVIIVGYGGGLNLGSILLEI